ncbi:MAG: peptidylprolyl isomerase [Bacteroidales bacterium]|nr:peptidylprolyl isomerase [Bacteroidales bacterium]
MKQFITTGIFIILVFAATAQQKIIDGVAAIVGENIVLTSDVESQYMQFRMQGNISRGSEVRCDILQNQIIQKMLLHQAKTVDSIEISDDQVEANMNQRLRYFVSQMGSEKKLEEYYNKSIEDIKDEFRDMIREQMLVQQERQQLTKNVNITPSEVQEFYKTIPKDSIPMVPTEYVIGHIVKKPPISPEVLNNARTRLKELRQRIIDGESFSTLAILYSQDPGSAKKGGELGFYGRGELYPAFDAVAFNLKKGEVSEIVKTKAGFHIIQLIERRGELINVRHILISPEPTTADIRKAKNELDSLARLIRAGEIGFDEAARKYSDNPDGITGGIMINPKTNDKRFTAEDLDPNVSYAVKNMDVGGVSQAIPMQTDENRKAYRIVYLQEKTEPHRANLKKDYSTIQRWAEEQKKSRMLREWIEEKRKETYIRINPPYKECEFDSPFNEELPQ